MNLHARDRLIPYRLTFTERKTESPRNQIYLREEITINFLFIYYVTSYAVRILAQYLVKRKTANNEYLNKYLVSKMKINNMGIFVAILAPVSTQLIRTSD